MPSRKSIIRAELKLVRSSRPALPRRAGGSARCHLRAGEKNIECCGGSSLASLTARARSLAYFANTPEPTSSSPLFQKLSGSVTAGNPRVEILLLLPFFNYTFECRAHTSHTGMRRWCPPFAR